MLTVKLEHLAPCTHTAYTPNYTQVVHGHEFRGSPASIHLALSFSDMSSASSESISQMAINIPERNQEFRVVPSPKPDDHDGPSWQTAWRCDLFEGGGEEKGGGGGGG